MYKKIYKALQNILIYIFYTMYEFFIKPGIYILSNIHHYTTSKLNLKKK